MKKLRNAPLYLVILCLFLLISACQTKKEPEPTSPKDEFKALESPLEQLEAGLIEVMATADLIPYYERQIQAKKQKEEEEKQAAQQSSGGNQATPLPTEEFKPEPITINETILTEVVKQDIPKEKKEEEKPVPEDIIFIWHDINAKINKLHDQWNDLKPKLTSVNVPENAVTNFGNALNNLTIASTEHKYLETLFYANAVSEAFASFMTASQDDAQSALYFIKYYAREIVLNSAQSDYTKADENYQALRSQSETLRYKLVEKDAKDHADKLQAAVDDLESGLKIQDSNLIKVKASIITKDIAAIKDTLAKK